MDPSNYEDCHLGGFSEVWELGVWWPLPMKLSVGGGSGLGTSCLFVLITLKALELYTLSMPPGTRTRKPKALSVVSTYSTVMETITQQDPPRAK